MQPGQEFQPLKPLPRLIFWTRWLQLPLYLGLIVAQLVYVWHFWVELVHLIEAAMGSETAVQMIARALNFKDLADPKTIESCVAAGKSLCEYPRKLNEALIMLVVLGLIDVVMISNLLVMVIVGGYETFVSKMNLEHHPDQPEWLSHVNASVLKVKLAQAIIGISSIHLLKTFIIADSLSEKTMLWQTLIHVAFLLSAIAIGIADKIIMQSVATSKGNH